jgi:hypothetical protein
MRDFISIIDIFHRSNREMQVLCEAKSCVRVARVINARSDFINYVVSVVKVISSPCVEKVASTKE